MRKKTTSVEPPDIADLDFKTKMAQQHNHNINMKSQIFDDVILPAYDLNQQPMQNMKVKHQPQNSDSYSTTNKSISQYPQRIIQKSNFNFDDNEDIKYAD